MLMMSAKQSSIFVGFRTRFNSTTNSCELSLFQVCDDRLRLHFYHDWSCYDFWTNAGSPDIRPVWLCEKTKHEMHVPEGKPGCIYQLERGALAVLFLF